jgi:hypothetical protein
MGSLLSAISGQFAKVLILGSLFPVIIVSVLYIALLAPLLPATAFLPALTAKIAEGNATWPAVVFTLVVFVLTGLLYNLNIPIIRIYEGYPWINTFTGRGLCFLEKRRLTKAWDLAGGPTQPNGKVYELIDTLTAAKEQAVGQNDGAAAQKYDELIANAEERQSSLNLFLSTELPYSEEFVLPTRLGNVIRSFELYSWQAYGMDAIVFWPRLVSKIDPGFASTVDEAKTTFDFMLNLSFLCSMCGFAAIAIGLARPAPLQCNFVYPWLWRAALFLLMSVIFYRFAINRARAWGIQVMAAFDLYRLDLLKALGYGQKPLTYPEEKAIWSTLSAQIQYPDDRSAPLPYVDPLTRVIPEPGDISCSVRRELQPSEPNLRIPVSLEVTNLDTLRPITALSVIDTLPDGYAYVPDSVTVSAGAVVVCRFAPLELKLDQLAAGANVIIRYRVKPASASK